ncbi:MAG: glycosyltransferase [Clostridia bacterium]|nr:glycosyltransferase [Clostridia bacterium]
MAPVLFFVIPCYNDANTLIKSAPVFSLKMKELISRGEASKNSRILFVNDTPGGDTWDRILSLCGEDPVFCGIDLAFNTGEQRALLAGMFTVGPFSDCVITMDSDLQDDINAVELMLEEYKKGSDTVLGVRNDRSSDALFERIFSGAFYLGMRILRTGLVSEHSNYRLMSRKAIEELRKNTSGKVFLPALVCRLPVSKSVVGYSRQPCARGESGYSFMKKLKLAGEAMLVYGKYPFSDHIREKLRGGGTEEPLYVIRAYAGDFFNGQNAVF